MQSIQAKIWDGKTKRLITKNIDNEGAVAAFAAQLADQHQDKDGPVPGFELSAGRTNAGTLAVAVAPFGWALIHTSPDHLTQHCTYGSSQTDKSIAVQWDEITSIPHKWFIPQNQAIEGIRQWLRDGSLSSSVHWSDQCY